MIVTKEEIVDLSDKQSLVGHLVLHCMAKNIDLALTPDEDSAEVRLLINGKEADLRTFVDGWQSQVDRMIDERAAGRVRAKLREMETIFEEGLDNIRERVEDIEYAT